MPIYEYACAAGHRFEKRQGFDADPVATCPACAATCERIIHVPTVHYKGSGFYTTDYGRSGSYQSDSEAATGDSTPKDKSASDSKVQTDSGKSAETNDSGSSSTTAIKDAD